MASRVLDFEVESLKVQRPAERNPAPELMAQERVLSMEEAEALEASREPEGSFAKGCFAGIALEVVAGVFLYGLWEVWHLFR